MTKDIMKLVDEYAYRQEDVAHTTDAIEPRNKAREAVVAALDALTKDAARYQWLRHGDNDEFVIKETPLGNPYISRNELLDAQIDAAMKESK